MAASSEIVIHAGRLLAEPGQAPKPQQSIRIADGRIGLFQGIQIDALLHVVLLAIHFGLQCRLNGGYSAGNFGAQDGQGDHHTLYRAT